MMAVIKMVFVAFLFLIYYFVRRAKNNFVAAPSPPPGLNVAGAWLINEI